jgi:hypothetical protein
VIERRLLALWSVPPLLFFVLEHVGQAGYLLILPATLLLQAVAILTTGAHLALAVQRLHRAFQGRRWSAPQMYPDALWGLSVRVPAVLAILVALTGAAVVYLDASLGRLLEPSHA